MFIVKIDYLSKYAGVPDLTENFLTTKSAAQLEAFWEGFLGIEVIQL